MRCTRPAEVNGVRLSYVRYVPNRGDGGSDGAVVCCRN